MKNRTGERFGVPTHQSKGRSASAVSCTLGALESSLRSGVFILLSFVIMSPALAHHPVPEPTPTPVPAPAPIVSSHSNFNSIALGALIVAGVWCYIDQCWKEKKEFSVKSQPGDDR